MITRVRKTKNGSVDFLQELVFRDKARYVLELIGLMISYLFVL